MIKLLSQIADVQAGHPFRGSVPSVENGNTLALQMRDITADGAVNWTSTVTTQLDTSKSPQWLQPGDIIFAARGGRNYAVLLTEIPAPAVCSQYFFLVRLKDHDVLPAFLAWQINQMPAQRYFASTAEGSDQLSIRRGVLDALPLAIPSIENQQQIIQLAAAAQQEKLLLETLIRNRQQQLDALALALISNRPTDTQA